MIDRIIFRLGESGTWIPLDQTQKAAVRAAIIAELSGEKLPGEEGAEG
jgi:hypothetical protein